ncbi:dixin-like isoform X2 [Lineus longissimus]|uniref:dixin-like isoform X2 n=1 Tax=Lineus longissimus TaxID=88925 RepID=UPI002B4D1A41
MSSVSNSSRGTGSSDDGSYSSQTMSSYGSSQGLLRPELLQQLHAYIAWMNSQLKRRPGSRMITDLTADMQNGVALIQLVEILSGESLHGNPCPTTIPEMRDNIDLVLQLMISKRIRMHQTNPRDIVEGNLKSIMRLILALAVHYKPNSVKQSAQQNLRTPAQQAVVAQVQNAAVALAETRKEVAGSGHKVRRPLDFSQRSDVPSDSDSSFRHYSPKMHRRRENLDGSYIGPQTTPQSIQGSPNNKYLPKSKSLDLNNAPASPNESGSDIDTSIQEVFQDLFDEHSGLTSDMQTTKGALLKLQELLLNGEPPEGSEDEDVDESLPIEGRTPDEKIVVLRNRLLHSEETCCDLRDELSRVKNECLELQGTKSGLQQRLNEQEKAFLQMKAELLRIGFTQQNLEAEKTDLQKSLNEKEMSLKDLKREMAHKDRLLEQLKLDLENEVKDKDMITRTLKGQMQELSEKLRRVGENEANLSSRVASQERMMAKLEGKIMRSHHEPGSLKPGHSVDSMLGHTRKPPLSSDHLDELNGRPHPKATKILYFTDRTVTPFMCTIPKNLGEITLGDFKQIHDKNKPGAYRYHFKALDPEFGTVKEEISNDDTILPGWEGKIVGWVEEDHG